MTQKPEPSNEEAFDLQIMDVDEVNFFYRDYTSTTSCMSHQFPYQQFLEPVIVGETNLLYSCTCEACAST